MNRASVLACFLLALLPEPASAQGGYRTEKLPQYGLEFPCARDYEPVPVQPTEEWVIVQYAEAIPKGQQNLKPLRPEFRIVWIDRPPTRTPSEQDGTGTPPAAGETQGRTVDDLASYVRHELGEWRLSTPRPGKSRGEYAAREFDLSYTPEKGKGKAGAFTGWVYAWESPARVIALIGFVSTRDVDDRELQQKIWRTTAEKLEISAPVDRDIEKIRQLYEREELSAEDYRIEVRRSLPRGWDAEDTEHYIVVFDTKDQPLIRIIKRELEAIHAAYVQIFPPSQPIRAVSTVRVCKDEAGYLQYGGDEGTGGYWNSAGEELVFFDYENVRGKAGTGKANSRIVLYHEAFHQYIHYSLGEFPPHSWFNEGFGDYFSGASIDGTKLTKIGVNPWRIWSIRRAIESGEDIPWEDIIRYEQSQYYESSQAELCYAQGWSMVYFLREAKEVAKRPAWAKILPTYFDVLKADYADRIAALEVTQGSVDAKARAEAGQLAREKAVTAAFEDVDFPSIEAAWREFTLALKLPR